MEQRISIVTLGVKNLETSKRFYVDGLGWKTVFENKEIIFFQAGGMVFALFLRDQLAADFLADPAALGRAAMALAHNVREKSEVDPLMQRAAAAGAKVLKPAREASWGGYSGYFCRPGWLRLGDSLEPAVATCARWQHLRSLNRGPALPFRECTPW